MKLTSLIAAAVIAVAVVTPAMAECHNGFSEGGAWNDRLWSNVEIKDLAILVRKLKEEFPSGAATYTISNTAEAIDLLECKAHASHDKAVETVRYLARLGEELNPHQKEGQK